MKNVTAFVEKEIHVVDDSQRDIRFFQKEESEFKRYGDEPIVRSKESRYRIHEMRKGASFSINGPSDLYRGKIDGLIKSGYQCISKDNRTVYLEKRSTFIVMNKDLDEIIENSIKNTDFSREKLENDSLKTLCKNQAETFNTQKEEIQSLHILIQKHGKLDLDIINTPWYKRGFGFRKTIREKHKNLADEYTKIVRNEN